MVDNYALWEQHDREQEAWLAKRPVCVCCWQPIQGDRLFDIDGELYCQKCAVTEFEKSTEDYIYEST